MPYGNDATIGIALQTSYGTAGAVGSLHAIPVLSEDFGANQEELLSKNLNGRFDEPDSYSGKRQYGGTLELEATPKALGVLLTAVVNDPTKINSGTGLATYTWFPRTGDWDRFSPERPFSYYKWLADFNSNSAQLFYDLCGSQIEFNLTEGGILTTKMTAVAGKVSTVSSQNLTQESNRRWPWNQASMQLNAVAQNVVSEFNLVHNEGVNPLWFLDGQLTSGRSRRQNNRTIRISGTLLFETQTELNNFKNETIQPLVLTVQDTTLAIQSGYFNTFTIEIPSFRWIEFGVPIKGPTALEVAFKGRAQYNTGSGTSIKYTLQNSWQTGY